MFGERRYNDAVVYNNKKQVFGRVIRKAIGQLASTFRHNQWPSPFHEEGLYKSMARAINDQFAAYDSKDPPPHRENAITIRHLKHLYERAMQDKDELGIAHTNLLIGEIFFAMQSCEYSQTTREKKTALLELRGITFTDTQHQVIQHNSSLMISDSHYVTICFRDQKNRNKHATRTQRRNCKVIMCPVRVWAKKVTRIQRQKEISTYHG
jgi:hypothetical protein